MMDGIWPVYVSPGVQSPFPNWAMYQRMAGAVVPALSQGFWGQRGLPMSLWGLIFLTGGRRTGWIRLWKWLDWNDIVLHYCYYVWSISIKKSKGIKTRPHRHWLRYRSCAVTVGRQKTPPLFGRFSMRSARHPRGTCTSSRYLVGQHPYPDGSNGPQTYCKTQHHRRCFQSKPG